ncbi:acetolactate synthase large subunit [Vibrio ishigakensis]|uniref:Acetolactate synthase large subunit n=1 Tax=Vibrio ishigakensis TaxID=1481914 RepID=A0A0B8NRP7_9VIBR|nr:acetolactate synthase large subunit [Vibrio ishigakensis]
MPVPQPEEYRLAQALLRESRRPVLYVGGGVQLAKATDTVRQFLSDNPMPSVSTLKGLVPSSVITHATWVCLACTALRQLT